jgi:hypothetical protein
MQSLDRLKNGGGDADLERRRMLEARIAAAKQVMPDTLEERQARMPFRSKQQQALLRARSRMEAALRDVITKRGMSMLQLTCMHDLGITASLSLSLPDKELLIDTPQWRDGRRRESIYVIRKAPASFAVTCIPCWRRKSWCMSFEAFASREDKAIQKNLHCARWQRTRWTSCGRGKQVINML